VDKSRILFSENLRPFLISRFTLEMVQMNLGSDSIQPASVPRTHGCYSKRRKISSMN
jgi:hypothetical protein